MVPLRLDLILVEVIALCFACFLPASFELNYIFTNNQPIRLIDKVVAILFVVMCTFSGAFVPVVTDFVLTGAYQWAYASHFDHVVFKRLIPVTTVLLYPVVLILAVISMCTYQLNYVALPATAFATVPVPVPVPVNMLPTTDPKTGIVDPMLFDPLAGEPSSKGQYPAIVVIPLIYTSTVCISFVLASVGEFLRYYLVNRPRGNDVYAFGDAR